MNNSVVEFAAFIKHVDQVLSDEARMAFVDWIAANPTAGAVIQHTGGARKVWVGRDGTGKRGGARVIYYFATAAGQVYLFDIYAKAKQSDLTPAQKKMIGKIIVELKKR